VGAEMAEAVGDLKIGAMGHWEKKQHVGWADKLDWAFPTKKAQPLGVCPESFRGGICFARLADSAFRC
jgi:hypothetical protein